MNAPFFLLFYRIIYISFILWLFLSETFVISFLPSDTEKEKRYYFPDITEPNNNNNRKTKNNIKFLVYSREKQMVDIHTGRICA